MRFLHTSDWHLGKLLRNRRRDDEFHAVLSEVLEIARVERVDCLLVAGDVFDSVAPPPEAERLAFDFFRELVGHGIKAVVIAGNHDHPRRLAAFGRILELVDVHVRAEPLPPAQGGIVEVISRDGTERALVAALPWVHERQVRSWERLTSGAPEEHFQEYAERIAGMLEDLARAFRQDTVNIALAHLFVDGAKVGGEASGERPLHLSQVYAIRQERLPRNAHYIALGHLHRHQRVQGLHTAVYPGSLLQLDFGEAGQEKCVYLFEATAERGLLGPPEVVRLNRIRQLRNVGRQDAPVPLAAIPGLAEDPSLRDAYLRVFVQVDGPRPGLAEQVRTHLPGAVEIVPIYPQREQGPRPPQPHRTPEEHFIEYHRQTYGTPPSPELLQLFNRLYEEVAHASP
jgi:exonuclease SbcD